MLTGSLLVNGSCSFSDQVLTWIHLAFQGNPNSAPFCSLTGRYLQPYECMEERMGSSVTQLTGVQYFTGFLKSALTGILIHTYYSYCSPLGVRTPRPMGVETWNHHCSEPRSLALNPGLLPLAWEGCLVWPCCNTLNHPELQGAPQNSSQKCRLWDSWVVFSSCGLPLPPLFFAPEIELLGSPLSLVTLERALPVGTCLCVCLCVFREEGLRHSAYRTESTEW